MNGQCVDGATADAGNTPSDAGPGASDAATQPADAGPPLMDAGPTPVDAGAPQPGGDGSSPDQAALSCQELHRAYPNLASDTFYIDPDGNNGPIEPFEVFCGMEYDDGGWTQVARLFYRAEVWNAWDDPEGEPGSDRRSWGVPLKWFSNDDDGRDLEILIGVIPGGRRDYYIGPSYSDVPSAAWKPGTNVEETIGDGFDTRTAGREFERCEAEIWRRNERWSWAISRGTDGCAGWAGGGGFVIYGSDRSPEDAYSVWGLNAYGEGNRGATFQAVELFVRRR